MNYPYIHPKGKIDFVPASNEYMVMAKEFARQHSLDSTMPNASVLVTDSEAIAIAANGSDYHKNNECQRVALGIKTGQGYDLCEGCHPKNHSEQSAIRQAQDKGISTKNAVVYLWGHWWCCESCWEVMIAAGVKQVFLIENSRELFDRESKNNIIGRQFD